MMDHARDRLYEAVRDARNEGMSEDDVKQLVQNCLDDMREEEAIREENDAKH